jgi:hypothetical protein
MLICSSPTESLRVNGISATSQFVAYIHTSLLHCTDQNDITLQSSLFISGERVVSFKRRKILLYLFCYYKCQMEFCMGTVHA